MSIDLSDLPPLSTPAPPTNTLLITNLQAPEIFTASNLDSIQRAINEHAPIHSFAPLKSFRRVVCSFFTIEDAVEIRKVLDGETVLGSRVRVYFGAETKIEVTDQHLQAPQASKMFFISPPPSPPMGWEMRNEDPPNKEVHAEDLAAALSRLDAKPAADDALHQDAEGRDEVAVQPRMGTRQRSGTGTVVYDPQDHGHSPDLPAIAVEDTSESLLPTQDGDVSPMEGVEKKFVHTARPPVELMEQ
ncbi:hypothetical protein B0A50_01088 [Salinomyces thailandicus]|uniref:Calcipressin n=1 Tax=Salinomyces thailandicus TaxID=706561 RepID=A0A4U0UDJ4_9PEZI|nr:hypothetical protein B0A50_01088 [Salinomyces thailandica]